MATLSGIESEVLKYLKSSLHHNKFEGVKASEIANNIDRPLKDVVDACEKLDQKELADIERRDTVKGTVKDLEIHIKDQGLEYLAREMGIPL